MGYDEWELSVPERRRADPLWNLRVYRTALYAGELGSTDAKTLKNGGGPDHLAAQLGRATSSISANIAEGFSRLGPRDRGKFYEYALGSAREARDWYYKGREFLGDRTVDKRIELHTALIRILIALCRQNRPEMPPAARSTA